MDSSLTSSTVMPLRDRSWLLTLAVTRLPSAYISGDNMPIRSSSSFRLINDN